MESTIAVKNYVCYKKKQQFEPFPLLVLYYAHTEPLSKFYNVLKVEDIYNYRLLVLCYNLIHKNVPFHIASFMPKTSIAIERYPIRQPR